MKIKLNTPALLGDFQDLLIKRHSCRDFQDKALKLGDLANILWASAGEKSDSITGATRTAPSAGATYPLELYVLVGKFGVDKLKAGLYRYIITEHALELVKEGEAREELSHACLGQEFIKAAPVSLIIAAKFRRTTNHYGERGKHYVYMEAGHASQNTYLAAVALGLGTVEVGAFIDEEVKNTLSLKKDTTALIIMPIGYPAGKT